MTGLMAVPVAVASQRSPMPRGVPRQLAPMAWPKAPLKAEVRQAQAPGERPAMLDVPQAPLAATGEPARTHVAASALAAQREAPQMQGLPAAVYARHAAE